MAAGQLANPTSRVIEITEDQRARWASLDTGRLNLTIARFAPLGLCLDLDPADALDAEGALLHDPARPGGDVRVELFGQRPGKLRPEPIVGAHFVGTGVATEARPDTAVVDLGVQPFRIVVGGKYRADRLAWRLGALLAHQRHEARLDVRVLPLPVALDNDPVHPAPIGRLLFADDRDVVLGVAGDEACLAAGAAIQIHHHCPKSNHTLTRPA